MNVPPLQLGPSRILRVPVAHRDLTVLDSTTGLMLKPGEDRPLALGATGGWGR